MGSISKAFRRPSGRELLKESSLKRYAIDFLTMNLVTLVISSLLYLAGRDIVGTFVVALFVESAFVLILGGVFGFILSSASFYAIGRLLGRKGSEKDKQEVGPQKEVTKEQIATGKRFVILGMALLAESILIALMLI